MVSLGECVFGDVYVVDYICELSACLRMEENSEEDVNEYVNVRIAS